MFSPDQMNLWFDYHPPSAEKIPKFKALGEAHEECTTSLGTVVMRLAGGEVTQASFQTVTRSIRKFADLINELCPDCSDKTAAMRCLRLARNSYNSVLSNSKNFTLDARMTVLLIGDQELLKALWQANSAIALASEEPLA